MGLLNYVRRLMGRTEVQAPVDEPDAADGSLDQAQAAAWLAAMESGKLNVPGDVHDAEAWDRYWMAHIEVGSMEQGFGDMMANDPSLFSEIGRRGARTILCVGNGFSSESWALAMHGFDVTVLDVSSLPQAHFRTLVADPQSAVRRMAGAEVRDEASIAFDPAMPVDPESCPPMHQAEGHPPRGGGSLTYVTGDLINADLCQGPFDVLIERRTVQLFRPEEQFAALDCLAARLAPRALLVSHQHYGAWRPQEPRLHFATAWAKDRGFLVDTGRTTDSLARVARLVFTTG